MTREYGRFHHMENRDGALEVILEELAEANEALDQAKKRVDGLRTALQDRMILTGAKKYSHDTGKAKVFATLVATQPIVVDFQKMLANEHFTDEEKKLFTETKYNKGQLEQAVDARLIDGDKVAPYLSREEAKYSVRFSAKEPTADSD